VRPQAADTKLSGAAVFREVRRARAPVVDFAVAVVVDAVVADLRARLRVLHAGAPALAVGGTGLGPGQARAFEASVASCFHVCYADAAVVHRTVAVVVLAVVADFSDCCAVGNACAPGLSVQGALVRSRAANAMLAGAAAIHLVRDAEAAFVRLAVAVVVDSVADLGSWRAIVDAHAVTAVLAGWLRRAVIFAGPAVLGIASQVDANLICAAPADSPSGLRRTRRKADAHVADLPVGTYVAAGAAIHDITQDVLADAVRIAVLLTERRLANCATGSARSRGSSGAGRSRRTTGSARSRGSSGAGRSRRATGVGVSSVSTGTAGSSTRRPSLRRVRQAAIASCARGSARCPRHSRIRVEAEDFVRRSVPVFAS